MIINRLSLKNWRNFRGVDVPLRGRVFAIGPNASGKSNLLDAFRFLRDVAKTEGGGLQKAVRDRGGIPKIRCLAARRDPEVGIDISVAEGPDDRPLWRYAIGIKQEERGYRQPILAYEKVWQGDELILDRPDKEDVADNARLTQTHLEQISANVKFRGIARFLQSITYLHLIPQLLRYADSFQGMRLEDDPFGQSFLELVAKTPEKTQESRLSKIQAALQVAVPQLDKLQFTRDEITGRPHLQAIYRHWRKDAGWQREDQFSDGTLRLVGLLWSLLDRDSLLLLEEPELSLHTAIVQRLPALIHRMQRKRQVIVSTHSIDLLQDNGIDPAEVLVLIPGNEGTDVEVAASVKEIKLLLEGGMSIADAVMPRAAPKNLDQLRLFE
jgi:predicted ATPase